MAAHDAPTQKTSPRDFSRLAGKSPNTNPKCRKSLAQLRAIQKRLTELALDPKVTANSLAQLAKAWSALESNKKDLQGDRYTSFGKPQKQVDAARTAAGKRRPVAFIESLPEALDELTIATRQPPTRPEPANQEPGEEKDEKESL